MFELISKFFCGYSTNKPEILEDNRIKSIREQIEYYLSPSSLDHNKRLARIIKNSENGFIPLSLLMEYNKMKLLSPSYDEIIEACEKSPILLYENGCIKCTIQYKKCDQRQKNTVFFNCFDNDDYLKIKLIIESNIGKISRLCFLKQTTSDGSKIFNGWTVVEFENFEDVRKVRNSGLTMSNKHYFPMSYDEYKTKKHKTEIR